MIKKFRSLLCLIICLGLVSGVVGCEKKIKKVSEDFTINEINDIMMNTDGLLYAKDIEFDIENNLDKKFFIQGQAELSNYYNYGFSDDIKKDYFCIKIRPSEETGKDDWYFYCSRKTEKNLYENLLKDNELRFIGMGIVPKNSYEKGQNNMAKLIVGKWK